MTRESKQPPRTYDTKMIKQGYGRVSLWVPEGDKEELIAIALEMRHDHAKKMATS